jgi:hypothetical protein
VGSAPSTGPTEDFEELAGRVRGIVISLSGLLTDAECAEVEHFLDHGEHGEALHTLAWLIVEEGKRVALEAIRELAGQMDMEHELPVALSEHASDEA